MTPVHAAEREAAVIDIGSNSVRLVLFRVEGRVLWPVFNEKTMAALGRGASQTGRLNPDGVEIALRALKRFALLLKAKQVRSVYAVATAAVRDCEDGPDFVERVRNEAGLEIEVLSGEEEGRRSALGILTGLSEADGIAGDLGGSSVELVRVAGQVAGRAISLPLGPLAMMQDGLSLSKLNKKIDAALEAAEPILKSGARNFYAVGGAWRAIAYLDMALNDYPLHLLHQYTLSADNLKRTCEFTMGQSESSLASIPGVSSKRAASLPYAASLLLRIVKLGRFERVVFCANGLREGVVCAHDTELLQRGDPLIAGVEALARMSGPDPAFGLQIDAFLSKVFIQEDEVFGHERDPVLRQAAARLADMGSRMHPDHRAELSLMETLYAPLGGVSHSERAFLALTMHHRYSGRKGVRDKHAVRRLLSEHQQVGAVRLGLALRLAAALSGRSAEVLKAFLLERDADTLILRSSGAFGDQLIVERAQHRFHQLASVMNLQPQLG